MRRRGRAGRTAAGRGRVLIIQSTRDDKMAYAGLSRERKVKRFVQGMRRPKAHMKENALEAWKVSGPAHEEE